MNTYNKDCGWGCTRDRGSEPCAIDLRCAAMMNSAYRSALWTGKYLQATVMCINPYSNVGLENHPDTDQLIMVESGQCCAVMGPEPGDLNYRAMLQPNGAVFVPAGTWHDIINVGRTPLKLVTVYAPPHHPAGTVHCTRADAKKAERNIAPSSADSGTAAPH